MIRHANRGKCPLIDQNRSTTASRLLARVAVLAVACVTAGCETPSLTFTPTVRLREQTAWTFNGKQGVQFSTDHVDIFTTIVDTELRDFLPEFVETTYQFYESILPPTVIVDPQIERRRTEAQPPKDADRLQVYLLNNRDEWKTFVKRRFPKRYPIYRKISAGGFSEGSTCVVYHIGRAATFSVLAHEGMHQYLSAHYQEPIPAWLNEGLATYCESVEFRKNVPHFVPQRNTFRIDDLRNAQINRDAIPLIDLLRTNAGEVIDGQQITSTSSYYAQAWALVVFLRHGANERYADGFSKMLAAIADGTIRIRAQAARVTSETPADTSYGHAVFLAFITEDMKTFEREFNEFIKRICWKK